MAKPRHCRGCGHFISPRSHYNRRFCSRRCRDETRQRRLKVKSWCEWCGEPLTAKQIKNLCITCSTKCRDQLRHDAWRRKADAEGLPVDCVECGIPLTRRDLWRKDPLCRDCFQAREQRNSAKALIYRARPSTITRPRKAAWLHSIPDLKIMVETMGARLAGERLGVTKDAVLGALHRAGISTRAAYLHRLRMRLPGAHPPIRRNKYGIIKIEEPADL